MSLIEPFQPTCTWDWLTTALQGPHALLVHGALSETAPFLAFY